MKQVYIATDIKFDGRCGEIVLNDFEVPANVTEINNWLMEFGIDADEQLAYQSYVRAVLFNRHEFTYNVSKLTISTDGLQQYADGHYIVDLNDDDYNGYRKATVKLQIPYVHAALLTGFELELLDQEGPVMAVFENMLTALPLNISVEL